MRVSLILAMGDSKRSKDKNIFSVAGRVTIRVHIILNHFKERYM